MDLKLNLQELKTPEDIAKLNSAISELADNLDVLNSTTAPNGNISGRAGQICLYNNSGTYTIWVNTTGSTVWQQVDEKGMQYSDTRFYIGSFTRDTTVASGTQVITGVGFTAKAIIFITSDISINFGVSFDNASVRGTVGQGYGGSTYVSPSNCGIFYSDGTGNYIGNVKTIGTDGFTITSTKILLPTGTIYAYFLALR